MTPVSPVSLFSTCPPSTDVPRDLYLRQVVDVARWSEAWGCDGMLVCASHALVDPWLVAQTIIRHTKTLCPAIVVQPVYMHPYSVAKIVATIEYLYDRRVFLSMVAGGFKADRTALGDSTPEGRRYDQLVEYTEIIKQLLSAPAPLSYDGEFYTVKALRLLPTPQPELFPGLFVSGSSEAAIPAAARLGATAIRSPRAVAAGPASIDRSVAAGVRLGIIAREQSDQAWRVARTRFPEDRRGQVTQPAAAIASDGGQRTQVTVATETEKSEPSPYWLGPLNSYKTTMCPYLVGSYDQVSGEVTKYVRMGYRTFILDVPPNAEELSHMAIVFSQIGGKP